jgi:hypothetical protein
MNRYQMMLGTSVVLFLIGILSIGDEMDFFQKATHTTGTIEKIDTRFLWWRKTNGPWQTEIDVNCYIKGTQARRTVQTAGFAWGYHPGQSVDVYYIEDKNGSLPLSAAAFSSSGSIRLGGVLRRCWLPMILIAISAFLGFYCWKSMPSASVASPVDQTSTV